LDAPGLKGALADCDGLAVRSATKVTAEILAAAPKLRVVWRAGNGVDNIDVPAATERGIVVMNTPYGNSVTTAEHAIALIFALARQIPAADRSTQAGKWEKNRFMGVELTGKTLGILGCGNIGSIVAERALGLRMKVIGYDPYLSPERARALGVEAVGLDDLLARADIITLHVPLTDATRGIIDAKALAKTKRGVRIVNCACGGLVVEADLRAALDSGHVSGAALDVFATEPATDNPLFGHPNVVATPHLGAATHEAQENVAVQVAEQMADFLLTGAVSNAVNAPSVTAEEAQRLKPYMALAQQLGAFLGQIVEGGVRAVDITYRGQVGQLNTRPLTAVALAHLLAPRLDSVNMVNAPVVARARGIAVREIVEGQDPDYQSSVAISVASANGAHDIAGTLVGGHRPRLVRVDGIGVEAELGQHMIYVRSRDKPGAIGRIGTLLGQAGVNIATFSLGRKAQGGDALALVGVDGPPDGKVLSSLSSQPDIVQVTLLRF
jgi:D-3-phosphoglycerate dehydrogenase